jgi:hypothetical protein
LESLGYAVTLQPETVTVNEGQSVVNVNIANDILVLAGARTTIASAIAAGVIVRLRSADNGFTLPLWELVDAAASVHKIFRGYLVVDTTDLQPYRLEFLRLIPIKKA